MSLSEPGRSLDDGRYSLGERLGEGGVATVWKARDERLQVWRAIKRLSADLAGRPDLHARFLTEARAMARLSHPNIVAVHDIREGGGRPFIVMEWVAGGDLARLVARQGPLAPRQAVELMLGVLDAVQAAHEAGVIHRDIKPANVLLTERGVPRVADFGIARVAGAAQLTATGTAPGTWAFMAPEQRAARGAIDHRVDVYAAGATLWFTLTGALPVDLFAAGLDDRLLGGVQPELREIIRVATSFRPEDRHPTAAALREALAAVLPGLPEAPPLVPAAPPRARPAHAAGHTLVPDAPSGHTLVPDAPSGRTLVPDAPSGRPLVPDAPFGRTLVPEVAARPSVSAAPDPTQLTDHAFFAAPSAPGLVDPPEAEAPSEGRRSVLPALILAALLLLAAGVAIWSGGPAPSAEHAPLSPPSPAPVEAPSPPPVTAPEATPAPDEAPPPAEAPTPRPAPVKPTAAPPVAPGAFVADGDALEVVLEDAGGRRHLPGALPPGRYAVLARFDAGPLVPAGRVEVQPGQRLRLTCSAAFLLCRVSADGSVAD